MSIYNKTARPLLAGICIFLSLLSGAHAEIRPTIDLQEIRGEIFACPKDTLVIFDIDMVLIMPLDQIFLKKVSGESNPFLKGIQTKCLQRHNQKECDDLESIVLRTRKITTVARDTVAVFNDIKMHGYKVLGLTLCRTGHLGAIKSMEQLRKQELEKLGFMFSQEFPPIKAGKLNTYIAKTFNYRCQKNCAPCAAGGIVFTCFAPKGYVLGAYLNAINMHPEKIIFIDDKLENLRTVEEYCQNQNINYVGFEYNAVKELAKTIPLDLTLADFQFGVLEQSKIWLNDSDAAAALKKL